MITDNEYRRALGKYSYPRGNDMVDNQAISNKLDKNNPLVSFMNTRFRLPGGTSYKANIQKTEVITHIDSEGTSNYSP